MVLARSAADYDAPDLGLFGPHPVELAAELAQLMGDELLVALAGDELLVELVGDLLLVELAGPAL